MFFLNFRTFINWEFLMFYWFLGIEGIWMFGSRSSVSEELWRINYGRFRFRWSLFSKKWLKTDEFKWTQVFQIFKVICCHSGGSKGVRRGKISKLVYVIYDLFKNLLTQQAVIKYYLKTQLNNLFWNLKISKTEQFRIPHTKITSTSHFAVAPANKNYHNFHFLDFTYNAMILIRKTNK